MLTYLYSLIQNNEYTHLSLSAHNVYKEYEYEIHFFSQYILEVRCTSKEIHVIRVTIFFLSANVLADSSSLLTKLAALMTTQTNHVLL